MRDHASFGYRIRETGEGWVWSTLDSTGRVQAKGRAPNKAVAAACVIRALARSAVPDAQSAA
jgi:hypothetical protein